MDLPSEQCISWAPSHGVYVIMFNGPSVYVSMLYHPYGARRNASMPKTAKLIGFIRDFNQEISLNMGDLIALFDPTVKRSCSFSHF